MRENIIENKQNNVFQINEVEIVNIEQKQRIENRNEYTVQQGQTNKKNDRIK